jgi:uncharacterized protein (DUF302 family)
MKPYLTKVVKMNFPEAIVRVTEILKELGFGIITEIDVKTTLKNKIDVDFRPYTILGACNPKVAHAALEKDDKVGILLPCNVVVQQKMDGEVEVFIINPEIAVKALHNPELEDFACEVTGMMKKVIARL